MTEKDPEHLYQDLRQKLEGYGSPPPESVWAGIRRQVPAQQPSRWRRLLPVLLLALLMGSLSVSTSYWRPLFQRPASSRVPRAARPATPSPETNQQAAASGQPTHPATRGETALSDPTAASAAAAGTVAATRDAAAANPARQPLAGAATTRRTLPLAVIAPDRRTPRPPVSPDEAAAARAALATRRVASRAHHAGLVLAGTDASRHRTRLQSRPKQARGSAENRAQHPADANASGLTAALPNEPLALRPLLPPPLAAPAPDVQRQRRPRQRRLTRQELRLRDWSVQLTAGPGLTYRLLSGTSTQLEGLERPAIGYAGQLTGAYAFSRQLTVAGGLGFARYTNSLRYTLRQASSDQTRQIDFRDTYSFLTLPLQAQLTLGGNHRWRYGVLGGGSVNLFTGARVTEGSACHCGQRTIAPSTSDSTFQRVNLALTAGVFANYQFAPGQWFTIRPQGQLFVNSLTQPGSTPRRPWNLGVQLGYSWDLDPRSH